MAAYLFAHFIGEQKDGEQVYFSVSKDGLHWADLHDGKPVLYATLGELGVRDPFLVRNPDNGKVYLIATDLRIEAGKGWHCAEHEGSRDLMVWETEDLTHWEGPWACRVGCREAGCVWAPEAVYDQEKKAFFVFFASMVQKPGDVEAKQRIYSVYTKDFKQFTQAECYMERENHVIDTTILEDGGRYYRISKDETTKRLILEGSDSLQGEFKQIPSRFLEELVGVEGPEGYRLPDGTWCVIADQFAKGLGYMPMVTKDLSTGEFTPLSKEQYHFGETKKRHGGVIEITDEEYDRLKDFYG